MSTSAEEWLAQYPEVIRVRIEACDECVLMRSWHLCAYHDGMADATDLLEEAGEWSPFGGDEDSWVPVYRWKAAD